MIAPRATARYVRSSPRKLRTLAGLMRKKTVSVALTQLEMSPKQTTSLPLKKALASALANAQSQWEVTPEELIVSRVTIDGGPVLKRWMPRARGMAAGIRKPTAHITIELAERVPGSAKRRTHAAAIPEAVTVAHPGAHVHEHTPDEAVTTDHDTSAEAKQESRKRKESTSAKNAGANKGKGYVKRFFSRKTGSS